jgi:hypothetical protein
MEECMRAFTRAAAIGFTLFVLAPPALAQTRSGYTERRTEAGSAVTFDDDLASGTTFDPMSSIVRARPPAARVTLLRPRYNFVTEMLKSVENL